MPHLFLNILRVILLDLIIIDKLFDFRHIIGNIFSFIIIWAIVGVPFTIFMLFFKMWSE